MKKIIITGCTGFIGYHLCKFYLNQKIEVYGIGRNENLLKELSAYNGFHAIKLDCSQYHDIEKIILERCFDAFFHLSYIGVNGQQKADYEIQLYNSKITCDLIEKTKLLGCNRFVYVGSVDEFEGCTYPDSKFYNPSHSRIYGIAKNAAEGIGKVIADRIGTEYVGAILQLTYGEGNRTNILPNILIKGAMSGEPINLITGNNYFDILYIDEAITGIVAVAEKGKNYESYYIGHTKLRTFKEIVITICNILNSKSNLLFGKYPDFDCAINYDLIDRKKLKRDTGLELNCDMHDYILKTKQWWVENLMTT